MEEEQCSQKNKDVIFSLLAKIIRFMEKICLNENKNDI